MSASEVGRQWLILCPEWVRLLGIRGLTLRGLTDLRERLRSTEWDGLADVLREDRALLLHAVCEQLVSRYGWPREYLLGVQDLLPVVPPDAREIDGA